MRVAQGVIRPHRVAKFPEHISIKRAERKKIRPTMGRCFKRRTCLSKPSKLEVGVGKIILHQRRTRRKLRRTAQRPERLFEESVLAVENAKRGQFFRIIRVVKLFTE